LDSTVFDASEVQEAFALMGKTKHVGKILVKIRDGDNLLPFTAIPRFYCRKDEVQVIVGGLGGMGMELAGWLIMRGCRKLVLTSRRGVTNGYQRFRIE
jgi:fatty acid synthase